MTESELQFQYTPKIAQRAMLLVLWDSRVVFVVASILLVVASLFALKNAELRPLACFGLGGVTMLWASWLGAYQWAGRMAARLRDPQVTVRLSDSGIEFYTPEAMSRWSWTAVRVVRRFKRVWIIEDRFARTWRLVPVEALNPEAKELIVRMVTKAGGLVQ